MRLYARQHLIQRLRREGLPHSDNTLMEYRKKGIIPKGDFVVEYQHNDIYLYSQETLDGIVEKMRIYKHNKKRVCKVLKCSRDHYARGFCRNHYMSRYYLKKGVDKSDSF